MATINKLYIDYLKVHQQFSTDTDDVYKAYSEFIDKLSKQGYKIIATIEFGDKLQQVEISVDENGKLAETKIV